MSLIGRGLAVGESEIPDLCLAIIVLHTTPSRSIRCPIFILNPNSSDSDNSSSYSACTPCDLEKRCTSSSITPSKRSTSITNSKTHIPNHIGPRIRHSSPYKRANTTRWYSRNCNNAYHPFPQNLNALLELCVMIL